MNNVLDSVRGVIRATGCRLDEALAIKVSDIEINGHGDMFVRIGFGMRVRVALVLDPAVLKQLMELAEASGNTMLIDVAVKTFDCTSDRTYYVKRLYAMLTGNTHDAKVDMYDSHDDYAITLVMRNMGEDYAENVIAMLDDET